MTQRLSSGQLDQKQVSKEREGIRESLQRLGEIGYDLEESRVTGAIKRVNTVKRELDTLAGT